MSRYSYQNECFESVSVCGIPCEFSGIRIDPLTVPKGKYMYEVGGDDETGGTPVRIKRGILVNFFGTLISDQPIPLDETGILWIEDRDFKWN